MELDYMSAFNKFIDILKSHKCRKKVEETLKFPVSEDSYSELVVHALGENSFKNVLTYCRNTGVCCQPRFEYLRESMRISQRFELVQRKFHIPKFAGSNYLLE